MAPSTQQLKALLDGLGLGTGFLQLRLVEERGPRVDLYVPLSDAGGVDAALARSAGVVAQGGTALFAPNARTRRSGLDRDVPRVNAVVLFGDPSAQGWATVVAPLIAQVPTSVEAIADGRLVGWRIDPPCSSKASRNLVRRLCEAAGLDRTWSPAVLVPLPSSIGSVNAAVSTTIEAFAAAVEALSLPKAAGVARPTPLSARIETVELGARDLVVTLEVESEPGRLRQVRTALKRSSPAREYLFAAAGLHRPSAGDEAAHRVLVGRQLRVVLGPGEGEDQSVTQWLKPA